MKDKKLSVRILIIALLFLCYAVIFAYQFLMECAAENYLRDFGSKSVSKIIIIDGMRKVEVTDQSSQAKILTYISMIDVSFGADLEAPGGMPMQITVIYDDGSQKELTLDDFAYSGIAGQHGFHATINGENAVMFFGEFFEPEDSEFSAGYG